MVLPSPLLFSVAAEGYLDYSRTVSTGARVGPGEKLPRKLFLEKDPPHYRYDEFTGTSQRPLAASA